MTTEATANRAERTLGAVLSGLFLLLILAPLAARFVGVGRDQAGAEYRVLAPLPPWPRQLADLRGFRTAFDRHWSDQFGFRSLLVRAHSRLLVFGLRTSPSDQVLIGRDRWLFYAGEGAYDDLVSPQRLSATELAGMAQRLRERRDLVEALGGHYLFVIVPNKESVYVDKLPDWALHRDTPSRLDQLLAYLESRNMVDVLDLRAALSAARSGGETYYRTDTHWNDRGAYASYLALMKRLQLWRPELQPLAAEDVAWRGGDTYEGDLSRLMLLQHELAEPRESLVLARPPALASRELLPSRFDMVGRGAFRVVDSARTNAPTLFVFHDSYMNYLLPYLPAAFSRTWFKWQPAFDDAVIRQLKPDLVVQETSERFLSEALRENPPGISAEQRAWRETFAASTNVVLALDTPAALARLTPGPQVRIEPSADGVALVATGPDPYLFLPAVRVPEGGKPVVRLSITSDVFTDCAIYDSGLKHADTSRSAVFLREGANELYLPLPGPRVVGPLRLDPAETAGTYNLRGIELRLTPAATGGVSVRDGR